VNDEQSNLKLYANNPFIGANTYEEKDRKLFKGRDKEINDIGFNVFAEPVFLVYGESGVGKSSLVKAGLYQWMDNRESNLYYWNCAEENDSVKVWDYIFNKFNDLPKKQISSTDRSHQVICFDSFERVFEQTETSSETRKKFSELTKSILETPDTSVVLMMRSEWLARLELYERLLPNNLKARYRIDPLSIKSAQKIIVDVAKNKLHPFDDTGAEWVISKITNAGDEFVDLTIMQIVCQWIWNKAGESERNKDKPIDKEWLEELNDSKKESPIVEASMKAVYEEKLNVLPSASGKEAEKKFRDWLGTAITINDANEIAPKVILRDLTPSFQPTINALEASHILRRVEVRTKTKATPDLFELAHDLWVKVISDSNEAYEERNEELIFDHESIQGMIPEDALKKRVDTIIVNIRAKEREKENYAKLVSELWKEIDTYDTEEIRGRDRRQAETYIGLMVLEGKPGFTWFSKETYHHLQEVRVRDAEYLRAYLLWERDGGGFDHSPDQIQSKRYFYYTVGSLKTRMKNRDIKIPHSDTNKSYAALIQYLDKIITSTDGCTGDGWDKANKWRPEIVGLKARWLEEDRSFCGRRESNDINWIDAVEYTKRFYTAVYQLIKKDENSAEDKNSENDKTIQDINALYQLIKKEKNNTEEEKSTKDKAIDILNKAINSEDKHSLINCFEAAILMYYASPELVEKAGLTGIFD
jgi:hypothetical protein